MARGMVCSGLVWRGARDIIRSMDASLDLLIQQWSGQPRLRALIQTWIDVYKEQIEAAQMELERQRNIEFAAGFWLDSIGNRLGLVRPSVDSTDIQLPFGFAAADGSDASGVGWDQAPFGQAVVGLKNREPLGDAAFRRMLKARGWYLRSLGTLDVFIRAVREIDRMAEITDNRDLTVTIATVNGDLMRLALNFNCLPKSAAVRVSIDDGTTYDVAAGVLFSQDAISLFETRVGSYRLRLASPPAFGETVTVTVSSEDAGKVSVSGGPFLFTRRTWSSFQGPVTVTAEADTDADNEMVNLRHVFTSANSGSNRYGAVDPALLPVTVKDIAVVATDPILTVGAFLGTTGLREGDSARVDISADIGFTGDRVIWFLVAQTGSYVAADNLGYQSVTMPEGMQSARLKIPTVDDNTPEEEGTLTATLSATDTVIFRPGAANRDAWDDVEAGDVLTVTDGTDTINPVVLSISRTDNDFTALLSPADWSDLSGGVTITDQDSTVLGSNWQAAATLANRRYQVSKATQGYGFDPDLAAVTFAIVDNDTAVTPEISVSRVSAATVSEGTNLVFRFAASPTPNLNVTVNYTVAQMGAVIAADELGAKTLLIPAGIASNDITIPTVDDDNFEPDGVVTVTVNTGTGYTVSSSVGSASGTVESEDVASLPGLPRNLVSLPGTGIRLTLGYYGVFGWLAPADDGGTPIVNYQYQLGIINSNDEVVAVESSLRPGTGTTHTTTSRQLADAWNTGRTYTGELYVRVRARTANGAGPWTEWTRMFVR